MIGKGDRSIGLAPPPRPIPSSRKKTSTGRLESRGADDGEEEEEDVDGRDGQD